MAQQRFYNATDKLVNAFIIGSLEHGEACSCAVGTLCNGDDNWADRNQKIARLTIAPTEYTLRQIFQMEKQFEGRDKTFLQDIEQDRYGRLDNQNDPDGFKGLCNVFDYLISIEDWQEEEKGANIFQLLETVNN